MTPRHGCRYPPSFYAANACGLAVNGALRRKRLRRFSSVLARCHRSSADYKHYSYSPLPASVTTAIISGLLLLFAVASIRDHRHHQRTIAVLLFPVACARRPQPWHPRSRRDYRMSSDDDCETESRPWRHAKFSFRARLRSRRLFVGGNDAALCLAGPHLPGNRRPYRAGAIRHVRPVFTVARRRQPCRHCIVCAVAPA